MGLKREDYMGITWRERDTTRLCAAYLFGLRKQANFKEDLTEMLASS